MSHCSGSGQHRHGTESANARNVIHFVKMSKGANAAPFAAAVLFEICAHGKAWAEPRSVVELFTSQGCSSCPPADAVVGRLARDPAVLVLSFHVDYWDELGWKDPYSSTVSTARQYAYARSLHQQSVFTPQLIVNGSRSLVGSQQRAVQDAVAAAHQGDFSVEVHLSRQTDGHFAVTLKGPPLSAEVWEARYVRRSGTKVRPGENGGHTLLTFDDVTQFRRLGTYRSGTLKLEPLNGPDDGIAILVQSSGAGRIVGADAY
jgi:hypothetical protein